MAVSSGWVTLHMCVTTPLFNGGAGSAGKDGAGKGSAPDPDMTGIRVPSLRGAMRFWFRALAGIVAGTDTALLGSLEHDVFGHTGHASPVTLRIPDQPALTLPDSGHRFLPRRGAPRHERENDPGRWIVYLLGQGLGDLRTCTVTRPYVAPGEDFDLKIRFRRDDPATAEAVASLALASLWLACAYGGIGGRTRRGFGGLRITGASGELPGPWDADTIRSPELPHYEGLSQLWPAGPAGRCMEYVKLLTVRHGARFALAPWPDPPPFPVLSKARAPAGISGGEVFGDWADAAAYAGEQLRRFRATKAYPGAVYQPQLKTPEWDNTIHGGQNRFRLGALGLPVVYKDRYEVNALGADGKPLRRASPLWLRPVGGSDGWRVLSYAFCGQFLPGAMPVSLRQASGRVKEVEVGDRDIAEYADLWIRKLAADEWFEVGDRPA